MKLNTPTSLFLAAVLLALPASAETPALAAATATDAPAVAAAPEKDRSAILAMAGEFAVTFDFRETASFQPGYELKKPYTENAHELVLVVKDEPRRIELQHLLVDSGMVIKHWRQVWQYEDTRICEYSGAQTWTMRDVPAAEAAGTWTQLVTQVDDSPRYEGIGRWTHDGGISQWTSGETWRPLPRREATKRSDYHVITGTNRHTLTANGWVHEQDNTKTILTSGKPTGAVAREVGVNTYRKLSAEEKVDFAAARQMWEKDGAYWTQVMAAWDGIQTSRAKVEVATPEKLRDLHKAINGLKDKPATDGKWPVTETLATFF